MAEKELKSLQFGTSGDIYKVNDVTARTNITQLDAKVDQNLVQVEEEIAEAVEGLASEQYVDNKVEGLASETYVNGKVEGLASKVYVDTAVDGLASKTYVDSHHDNTKQNTSDEGLNTINKTIVGAINEVNNKNGLPAQAGHENQFLKTDGTSASWATVDALPSQAGHDNQFLKTNGTSASWETVDLSSKQDKIDAEHKLAVNLVDGAASETYVNNHHDSTKQDKIDAEHKLDVSLVNNAVATSTLNSYATKTYVDTEIAPIEASVDIMDENLINRWEEEVEHIPFNNINATTSYLTSVFNGWYGGVGHPPKVDYIEAKIGTRGSDIPVTKIWWYLIKVKRGIENSDFLYSSQYNQYIGPYIGGITEFIIKKAEIVFDEPLAPNTEHILRYELPTPYVNTGGYDLIAGFSCNNFINSGYTYLANTNLYNGSHSPWIHYTTWNTSTQAVNTPVENVVGVQPTGEPDQKGKFNCSGNPYLDESTSSTNQRWFYFPCRIGYNETVQHTDFNIDESGQVTDMIEDHDYTPEVSKAFDDMGLTEKLDKAETASQLIADGIDIGFEEEGSSVNLVTVQDVTTEFKYFDPASTFTGEFQVIGKIPADVKISGFRVPFMARTYAASPLGPATKAIVRLYEADGYPCVKDASKEGSSSTSDYKKWADVEGRNNVPIRQKIVEVDLQDVTTPNDYTKGKVIDFIFDQPYYNTSGKVLYLSVNLDARFFRTCIKSQVASNALAARINALDGTNYQKLISWYSVTPTVEADPAPTIGWLNTTQFAFSIITATPVKVPSDMFNEFVQRGGDAHTIEIANQAVENYIQKHPFQVPANYEVRLPKKIYAVQGDKIQLFWDGIIKGVRPSENANLTCRCSVGKEYPRYFEFTPAADGSQNGQSYTLTVYVRNFQGGIVTQGSTTIEVVAKPTFSSATKYNMLCFGDSLTSSGTWFGEGLRRLTGPTTGSASPTSWAIPNLTLDSYGKKSGSVQSFPIYHEGYGGWTWGSFLQTSSAASTVNGIFLTMTSAPGWDINVYQHSIWVDQNNKQWKLEDINGAKIKFDRGPNNTAAQSATQLPTQLTCSSPSQTITTAQISTVVWESGNPFYDDDTKRVNFVAHATELGHQPADIVSVLLTWNGGGGELNLNADTKIQKQITDATTLLRIIHSDLPNAKIIVMGIQISSTTGGAGANYGAVGTYSDSIATNFYAFDYDKALETLVTNAEFGSYCYYCDTKSQFDTPYLMPFQNVVVNPRSTITERIGTNGVHPSIDGYYAIGDAYLRTLCKVLNDTKANYEGNNV